MEKMWAVLSDEFEKQEKEDKDRMTSMLETAIREELDCPEHYIDILQGSSRRPGDILRLSVKDTPVRVSSGISIRKHTLCQIPYYHTHDFYELIYVYQGNAGQYLPGEKTALKMSAGDICLLTPGKIHAMLPSGEDDIILKKILSDGEIENQIKNMILSIYGLQHRGGAGGENDEEQDKKQTIRREDQRACPDPFRAGL